MVSRNVSPGRIRAKNKGFLWSFLRQKRFIFNEQEGVRKTAGLQSLASYLELNEKKVFKKQILCAWTVFLQRVIKTFEKSGRVRLKG